MTNAADELRSIEVDLVAQERHYTRLIAEADQLLEQHRRYVEAGDLDYVDKVAEEEALIAEMMDTRREIRERIREVQQVAVCEDRQNGTTPMSQEDNPVTITSTDGTEELRPDEWHDFAVALGLVPDDDDEADE